MWSWGRASHDGVSIITRGEEISEYSVSPQCEDTVRKRQIMKGQELNPPALLIWSSQLPEIVRKWFCLSHQSKVLYYGSLSIQIQIPSDSQIKYYPSDHWAMWPGFMDHIFLPLGWVYSIFQLLTVNRFFRWGMEMEKSFIY